jgi:hypothetical protein
VYGRGGVYGEFSVRVLRQPDVNEEFDKKAASLTGFSTGKYIVHIPIIFAQARKESRRSQ